MDVHQDEPMTQEELIQRLNEQRDSLAARLNTHGAQIDPDIGLLLRRTADIYNQQKSQWASYESRIQELESKSEENERRRAAAEDAESRLKHTQEVMGVILGATNENELRENMQRLDLVESISQNVDGLRGEVQQLREEVSSAISLSRKRQKLAESSSRSELTASQRRVSSDDMGDINMDDFHEGLPDIAGRPAAQASTAQSTFTGNWPFASSTGHGVTGLGGGVGFTGPSAHLSATDTFTTASATAQPTVSGVSTSAGSAAPFSSTAALSSATAQPTASGSATSAGAAPTATAASAAVAPIQKEPGWRQSKATNLKHSLADVISNLDVLDPLTGNIVSANNLGINFAPDDLADFRTKAGLESLLTPTTQSRCLVRRLRRSQPTEMNSDATEACDHCIYYGAVCVKGFTDDDGSQRRIIMPLPQVRRIGTVSSDRGMYVTAPQGPLA
ncbi:unnamed protein product [Cercospora beticola]|nr:unnamed protein product [Cercospora beticola]